jgi:hypothetical protein
MAHSNAPVQCGTWNFTRRAAALFTKDSGQRGSEPLATIAVDDHSDPALAGLQDGRLGRKLRGKSMRFKMIRKTRKACNAVLTETETKTIKRTTMLLCPSDCRAVPCRQFGMHREAASQARLRPLEMPLVSRLP